MKNYRLTFYKLVLIILIFGCTAVAWWILGASLLGRTVAAEANLRSQVGSGWGFPQIQPHPKAWHPSPIGDNGRRSIAPAQSDVRVRLTYDPKQKGLMWYRTYWTDFSGTYVFENPTPIAQTLYLTFSLPAEQTSFYDVKFRLNDAEVSVVPEDGKLSEAANVPPGGKVTLHVSYRSRGLDDWRYSLDAAAQVKNFSLEMTTDFAEIDFPAGVGSPTSRDRHEGGWIFQWSYPDVIEPMDAGMAMPNVLNAGPVAARISFFAPVSLLFYFAVLLILGVSHGVGLHPIHYFFLAAGFFAFQLLFAYLVDVLPVHASFVIAAAVSLSLATAYVFGVGGWKLVSISAPAQFAYMVLFSYSFFFDGLSGLTITIGAVATLALLMAATARTDWESTYQVKKPVAV